MTTLATTCPSCGTCFRVVQDQLKASEGWVRCGHCQEVFNALEGLFELDSPTAVPPPAPGPVFRQQTPAASADDTPLADWPAPSPPSPPSPPAAVQPPSPLPPPPSPDAPPAWASAPAWTPGGASLSAPQTDGVIGVVFTGPSADTVALDAVQTAADEHASGDAPQAAGGERGEHGPNSAPPLATPVAPDPMSVSQESPHGEAAQPVTPWMLPPLWAREQEVEHVNLPLSAAAPLGSAAATLPGPQQRMPPLVEDHGDATADAPSGSSEVSQAFEAAQQPDPLFTGDDGTDAAELGQAAAAADADADAAPEFVRHAERRARWERPRARAVLATLAVLLVLGIVTQVVWHGRERLAYAWPALRPVLSLACEGFGCSLRPPQLIDALVVDNAAMVHPPGVEGYRLSVTLHNRADHPVAAPHLELVLSTAEGDVMLRRVLRPEDFRVDAGAAIAPQSDVNWTLEFTARDPSRVAGYTVAAFYP